VRPTGDRAREAWMSIVHSELPHARVLDLCAGSGALGFEALSRGAAHCDFVELAAPSLRAIRENAEQLRVPPDEMTVHRTDAVRFAQRLAVHAYDVAFADPPYNRGLAPRLAEAWLAVPFAHIFGVEHDAHEAMPPGGSTRVYGGTAVTIYRAIEAPTNVAAEGATSAETEGRGFVEGRIEDDHAARSPAQGGATGGRPTAHDAQAAGPPIER